jgi:hypothetical protein
VSDSNANDRGARGRLDFQSGTALAVASVAAIFWLIPRYVPGEAVRGEIAPSTFPYLTAYVVLICSIALMITNWRNFRSAERSGGSLLLVELAGWVAIASITLLAFDRFGFIASGTFAVVCAMGVTRYRQHLWLLALIALGLPFLLKIAVWQIFSIQLP